MSEAGVPHLDFRVLDELALAAERGRLADLELPTFGARDIGPLFELSRLTARGLLPAASDMPWLTLDGLGAMADALRNRNLQWVCPKTRRAGFLRTKGPHDTNQWTAFGLAAQQAAAGAGFPKAVAAQLTAALGELHSNIYEHARDPETGIVVFQACPGRFEFVVSDGGVGVLHSLRENPAYANLNDHGEALRLTLTDGVSRFGKGSDRGHGFQPLFIGLANLNGALRFRSGDHALLVDGQNPSLMTARTAQKPEMQGFLVSVTCEG